MENKPLDTDVEETTDETLDEIFDETSEEESKGVEDVKPTPDAPSTPSFQEKLEEVSGRKFKDEEDAVKHYQNLSSYVGKKEKPKQPESENELVEIKATVQKIQFLNEVPEAKSHFDGLVVPLAVGKNISLKEAWESVQLLVKASEEKDSQKDTGVSSKNRIAPLDNPKLKKFTSEAREGSPAAKTALIEELLKSGQLG